MEFLSFILFPIESLFSFLLQTFFSLTNNYGLSIIFLSIAVNIMLLPVYLLAERQQEKELHIKQKMQPRLGEIKIWFSGQERFMMTQTLYRLHHYHPIMGLRSMFSLLIQIPFFFAAYEFLKHFNAFDGVSWFFIQNLYEQDKALSLGHITINILPILMTAINIYSAKVYTLRKNPQALSSTLLMALIFLVLLYNSPAALVLYWTMNNINSLIKNLILRWKERTKNKGNKDDSPSLNSYHEIKTQLKTFLQQKKRLVHLVLFLWLISAYFFLSYFLTPINKARGLVPNQLVHIATIFALAAALLLFLYRLFFHTKPRPTRSRFASIYRVICSPSFYWQLLCWPVLYWIVASILLIVFIFIPEYAIDKNIIMIKLIALGLYTIPNLFLIQTFIHLVKQSAHDTRQVMPSQKTLRFKSIYLFIIILASLSIAVLYTFSIPADIYLSAPSEVGVNFMNIARYKIPQLSLIVVCILLVYMALRKYSSRNIHGNIQNKIQLVFISVMTTITIISLLYAFIIPYNMGRMDHFKLMQPLRLSPSLFIYVLEGAGLSLVVFGVFRYIKTNPVSIFIILLLFQIPLYIPILTPRLWKYTAPPTKLSAERAGEQVGEKTQTSTTNIPESAKDLFSFSPDKKNIVVILLDMANGGHAERSFNEYPQLKQIYDGFTWYPNTLSISTYTASSKPAMMGGWDFSPKNIAHIKGNNLAQKIEKSYNRMFDTFKQFQYDIRITGASYYGGDNAQCKVLEEDNIRCLDYWDFPTYTGYWLSLHPEQNASHIALPKTKKIDLLQKSALLRLLPIMSRALIYDAGNWNTLVSSFENQEGYNFDLREWALIDSLDTISSIQKKETTETQGTFTFIHSNLTHRPYALDTSCQLQNETYPDEIAGNDYEGDAAYISLKCSLSSLGRWIAWLQKNNIYDNTKIILVSDHGNDFTEDPSNIHNVTPAMMGRENGETFSRSHVLLMIKDFNAKGVLKIDNRFMSNADTASIMFHSIDGYVAPASNASSTPRGRHKRDLQDPTTINALHTTLPIYHTNFYNWIDMVKEKNTFEIIDEYSVKDDLFFPENWEKIR